MDRTRPLSFFGPKPRTIHRIGPPRSTAPIALAPIAIATVVLATVAARTALADPPAGYYATATGLTGAPLAAELHEIIDDHLRLPYTSSSTDTWDVLAIANANPAAPGQILTVYRNASVIDDDHSQATGFNREHTWPSSYGFTDDGPCNSAYTDLHHLMPADWDYNTARGNRVYDFCTGSCDLWPVDGFPATPNRGTGFGNSGSWEVWPGRRGDVARALFYLSVRYDGDTHAITGCSEPDLILTNNRALIVSNTSSNYSPAYMGELSTLIQWHLSDPVDDFERNRNDVIFGFQGNRNPFVDHPEWVCMVFACAGGDPTPPAAPEGLAAVGLPCAVDLSWDENPEFDVEGYRVSRSLAGGPAQLVHTGLLAAPAFLDATAPAGVSAIYTVVAVDLAGNESAPSIAVSAMASAGATCDSAFLAWINEFHYDNDGTDVDEGVEVAGPAGTDLTGWVLQNYDGVGSVVGTVPLAGVLPDLGSGFGVAWFPFPALRNTGPAAIALIDDTGAVLEFIGYEGTVVATSGAAAGSTAPDIGVSESATTQVGTSIQRVGIGAHGGDFTWLTSVPETAGTLNP